MQSEIVLPNFLIVGAMKAGTSSLADMMNQHDDIFVAKRELHFFNNEDSFGKDLHHYSKNFLGAGTRWIGEKTPIYSRIHDFPFLPERICKSLGDDIRVFWILRDPVERAISHYRHMLITQSNPDRHKIVRPDGALMSFSEVVKIELEHPVDSVIVTRGYYDIQIARYLDYFPRSNFFFCRFDELTKQPQALMDAVCEFLDIAPFKLADVPGQNLSQQRLDKSLLRKIYVRLKDRNIPSIASIINYARQKLNREEIRRRYYNIDEETKAVLSQHYASHCAMLDAMVDWSGHTFRE